MNLFIALKVKVQNQIRIKSVDISDSTFIISPSSRSETVLKAGDRHQGEDSEWALECMMLCAGEKLKNKGNEK